MFKVAQAKIDHPFATLERATPLTIILLICDFLLQETTLNGMVEWMYIEKFDLGSSSQVTTNPLPIQPTLNHSGNKCESEIEGGESRKTLH